jgi:amino acid adenylation domain-containing protein
MDRFTAFPDIYPADGPPGTEVSWQIGAAPISLQDAVLSWALLLSSVTGEEFPVFALNQTPVKVDLSENRFAAVDIDEAVHESRDHGYTAIVTDDSQRTYSQSEQKLIKRTYNLCLNLDLATGSGYLQSEIGIHVEGLVQIGGQLKQFMQRLDQSRDFPVGISSTDVPLLSIANPNPQILPGPQLLHQLAFNHGRRLATALDFLGPDQTVQSLSYEDLDNLSTTLAGHVAKALGSLHSESTPRIVPVLLPQSVDLYIAWLAILKAGAAFCPLGTDSPEDRINFILKDVAAEVIITQTKLSAKLPKEKAISVILVDKLQNEIDATKEHVEEPPPTELAYVMYTSGSTGRPKGVGISHLAVTQSLLAHDRLIPSFRRFLQFASPTFDVSVFEVFFPWFRGTTLVGSERTTMLHDLPSVINRLQVDAAELTPTVAGELLLSRPAAPSLNVLLTIGEMLTKRVVDEFAWSSVKEGILHGMYGPTEAAIHCTVAPKFETGSRVNLIGRPLQTVSAFVISLKDDVNSHNPEFLPIGHIGELVVGGPQLTTGYINRPSENSKAFLQSREHGRLYRTGDKARFLPNGDIECLGRISTGQVKLRGQRVELGEIENVICMAQNVRSAIAIVVDRILVVWVLADNDDVVAPQLRRFCQQRLPSYMIPGDFVIIHEVPRLPSGKVDKKALESEYIRQNRSGSQDTTRTFRDELEEKISIVVIETLRTPVGSSESLATAGLDSLTGIQLASGLRRRGVNIDVGKLLAADTIEGIWRLAKRCEGAKSKEEVDTKVASLWNTISEAGWTVLRSIGVHSEIENVEPCSHIQAAMLAESFRDPRSYCNWVELHFDDGIALMSIKEAICKVAECNDILRSGFLNIDVPGNTFCRFTWKSLRLENFQETDLFDRAWAVTGASGILVPFRVQLRRVKKSVQALVHLHHALYDGWSWELFLSDLQSSLDAAPLKRRPPYSNVVRHLMEFSLSESIADSTSYWEDAMRDVVPSTWPSFHDKTDTPQGTGTADRALGIPLVEIDNVAKRLSISRQTFFQAAFAYLLSSYLDTSDVLFGTVFSGRTSPVQGIEDIIGPCLRVLPTRLNLAWVRTITDLLLATHKSNRKSLEYGDLSLREIKKVSEIRANGPLFDSLIVWQETPWTDLTNTECQFKEHAAAEFLEFSMTIQLEPRGDAVSVRAVYDRSIFPAAQVNMFLEQIESVTSLFVRSPDLSLTAVNGHLSTSVLSVDNTEYEHQEDMKSLAYGVELLAVDDPQRNAIEFLNAIDPETGETDVDTITYYQFNSQANRLARHLASLGVVSGDLVAIILDKSINLYISILAVIKLGAGYVPLTPQTPSERIEFALAQSKPRLCILTSKLRPNLPSLDSLHFLEFEKIDIERYPDSNISSVHNVGNIAYIVFTSGSTGRPKGVQITHHNLQSNISVLTSIYPVGNDAKILQACSQAFDGESRVNCYIPRIILH